MSNWDFGKASTMQESMETIRKRKARAIVLSTVMNASEFEGRCKTEDPYKLIRQSINRTIKMVKCAKEQDKRGLYFVLEAIEGDDNEINQVVGNLINQKGIMVSD
jgi:mevalonate pyrophosphate decarboxylase